MVDYSKWDKLEISDDSDIEVHPNVDKTSFIRWKQRDIHEKRMEREHQIKGLKVQKEMYTQLNKRVDFLLAALGDNDLSVEGTRNSMLNSKFDKDERCTLESNNEDGPPYNQMVEDLFTQIIEDLKKEEGEIEGSKIRSKVLEHRAKINGVLEQIDPKIEEFEKEKHAHITSEDIHDGWNSSFINKKKKEEEAEREKSESSPSTNSSKTTIIETLNTSASKPTKKPSKPISQLGELELLKETETFLTLPSLKAQGQFILEHPFIACTHQKDAVLLKAFDLELNDKRKEAIELIKKGILLQFCADLLENPPYPMPEDTRITYVKQLLSQMENDESPGKVAYDEECKRMIDHVKTRCKIIRKEQEAEQEGGENSEELVEQIQLRSVDPNSKLIVTIPEEGTKEYEIYKQLPEKMRDALATGSLDEVNRVFASIPVDDAEAMLEKFNESGVIGVQALLDNESQFQELVENEKKFEEMKKAAESIDLNDQVHQDE